MLTVNDMQELNTAVAILAGGLDLGPNNINSIPLEVLHALGEARQQMESLPDIIENLNLSFERFSSVSSALWRMMELAKQAANYDCGGNLRENLNNEFTSLAAVVAADAGRSYYSGPRLNLLNPGEAQSAIKILGYLAPVMKNTALELSEQKTLIYEAIKETINFLGIIAQCYPDSKVVQDFGRIASKARNHTDKLKIVSLQPPVLH